MTFRSDATEGVWSPTQNVAVQTEANVVAIFFFHQCGFYDPTHHIRGCQKIIWNFALKGRALETQAQRARARRDKCKLQRAMARNICARGNLKMQNKYILIMMHAWACPYVRVFIYIMIICGVSARARAFTQCMGLVSNTLLINNYLKLVWSQWSNKVHELKTLAVRST